MKGDLEKILTWCALGIAGDVGPYTVYTNKKGKVVFYPRSPPTTKPTPAQLAQRDKFRLAAYRWSLVDAGKRREWRRAADGAALPMHGYDLFTAWTLGYCSDSDLQTIARQSGANVP